MHTKSMAVPEKYSSLSPLMIACEEDKEEIVQLLISKGASIALKNKVQIKVIHEHTIHIVRYLGSNHSVVISRRVK